MAYKNNAKVSPASPSYVDFEPKTELKKEEGVDTLIISVPGFKKEQLRVQVSNVGILKVSGEKPENTEGIKIRRFIKETTVPKNCNINEIRAKFANDELRVIMPKKVTPPPHVVDEQNCQRPEDVAQVPPTKSEGTLSAKPGTVGRTDPKIAKEQMVGFGSTLITKLRSKRNDVVIGLGVAMMAMVGIGAFVAYKYGSFASSTSFMEE
ncbi:hypothetical protein RND81_13G069800 [Saponaria officinalis]|uniref:SHSP domain-containing protein n=1 Tax=Saponaria officinalis TaxID=3572 RepID=A0AAW1GXR4_SAPOF